MKNILEKIIADKDYIIAINKDVQLYKCLWITTI